MNCWITEAERPSYFSKWVRKILWLNVSKATIMSGSITKDGFLTSDTISMLLQILMSGLSKTDVKIFEMK